MINKTIDRWAYQTDNFCAMCWVTVESKETCELVYRLHTDRTPHSGKGAAVSMPWFTVNEYATWGDLVKACPPAVMDEGIYTTSLIGRGELREVDVVRMVKPELDELREAANDPRTPFEILLSASE